MQRSALVAAVVATALLASHCRRDPSDLREWRPSDHSHENGESADLAPPPPDDDPLVAAQGIWTVQCATCHGAEGRGDGPQAPLTHPPDLTASAFQAAHGDAELRTVIMTGRNMMPPFGGSIRPEGIEVLVRFVRTLGNHPVAAHAPTPPSSPL